ncbi:MAG: prepilin-type N-terminal cleavage/methylation domain-containing protein [Eubacterium sp.]|nr:prepilin-type N-terminal cleavage/methylation domain-containing protein [Eubacterium sp.]
MNKKNSKKSISVLNNKGTTLVEMLVCFMMLAIFLVAAFSIITNVSSLYYQVKGETYGKQVSDILMNKIQSEVEGAKFGGDVILIGDGTTEGTADNPTGSNITLYDKTDTRVMIFSESASAVDSDNVLKIKYYGFNDPSDSSKSRSTNTWQYDKKMYNGYKVSELRFIKGSALGTGTNKTLASSYGITNTDDYDDDVMVVLLNLDSDHYGEYKTYRFIKMYNYDAPAANPSPAG